MTRYPVTAAFKVGPVVGRFVNGDRLAGKTALVTGGAGFVGSHLVEALTDLPATTRVIDDCSTGDPARLPAEVSFIESDIRDESALRRAMENVDVVFHEAAAIDVTTSIEEPRRTQGINVDGTLAVLEAARRVDATVVVASSAAIYGDPASTPIEETAPKEPLSPYGLQKYTADTYTRLYADLYDLNTVALRYFNIYGPGHGAGQYAGVVEVFRRQARNGEPLTVHGDGKQTRDFVHVADVVEANLAAATSAASGEAYNIASGDAITIRELAEEIRTAANAAVPIEHTEPRPGDIRHSEADVSKARRDFGFETTIDLQTGIADLIEPQSE